MKFIKPLTASLMLCATATTADQVGNVDVDWLGNDIIIEVNGKSVSGTHDADGYLDSCEPGKVATIKVARGEDGREFVIKATPQNLLSMIEEKRRKRAGQASSR